MTTLKRTTKRAPMFDLRDLHTLSLKRDEVQKNLHAAVTAAPAGRIEELWDDELLTLGQVELYQRWREEAGLEP